MAVHYTYLNPIISDPNWQKVVIAVGLGALLVALGRIATAPIRSGRDSAALIIPKPGFSLFNLFDVLVGAFIGYFDSIMGKENRRYAPLCGTMFFFIFFSNLLGLIPGMPSATTTVWVNVAMALVVFVSFNWYGIREQGIGSYLKHFCGPILVLAPILFPIEILSTCLRILTLNLRLYWNISADHIVLGVFTDLAQQLPMPVYILGGFLIPVCFYLLGAFVAFMQAFVFTTLSMIYIQMAVAHEHEHEGAHH